MWTKRENATLKDLWTRKTPPREIADKMKKTHNAVLGKIFRLKKKDGYVPKMTPSSPPNPPGNPGWRRRDLE